MASFMYGCDADRAEVLVAEFHSLLSSTRNLFGQPMVRTMDGTTRLTSPNKDTRQHCAKSMPQLIVSSGFCFLSDDMNPYQPQ